MEDLPPEINEMLNTICELYEKDTGKDTDHVKMVSGFIRMKHEDLVKRGVI